ncbi:hypothetical protein H671_2g7001 [Cricetulus griseus]|nr:hypothetical protein H671_2g7001 [Cricetulus griseus]
MADLGSERSPSSGAAGGGWEGRPLAAAGSSGLGARRACQGREPRRGEPARGSRQPGVRVRKCPKPFWAHGLLAGSGGGGGEAGRCGDRGSGSAGEDASAHPPAADRRRRQT